MGIETNKKRAYSNGVMAYMEVAGRYIPVNLPRGTDPYKADDIQGSDILIRSRDLDVFLPYNPYSMLHMLSNRLRYIGVTKDTAPFIEQDKLMTVQDKTHYGSLCERLRKTRRDADYKQLWHQQVTLTEFNCVCRNVNEELSLLPFTKELKLPRSSGCIATQEWTQLWVDVLSGKHTFVSATIGKHRADAQLSDNYAEWVHGVMYPDMQQALSTICDDVCDERVAEQVTDVEYDMYADESDVVPAVVPAVVPECIEVQTVPEPTCAAEPAVVCDDEQKPVKPLYKYVRNNNDEILEQAGLFRQNPNITCDAMLTFKLEFKDISENQLRGYAEALKAHMHTSDMDLQIGQNSQLLVIFARELCDGHPAEASVMTESIKFCCANADVVYNAVVALHAACKHAVSKL